MFRLISIAVLLALCSTFSAPVEALALKAEAKKAGRASRAVVMAPVRVVAEVAQSAVHSVAKGVDKVHEAVK